MRKDVWIAQGCLALVVGCAAPMQIGSPPGGSPAAGTVVTDSDYRRIEREVLDELNAARANPHAYSAHLSQLLPQFDGNLLRRPGAAAVRTQEGAAAVRDAINALNAQTAVPALMLSPAIARAAHDLADEQGRTGNVGHIGSDASTPDARLARYGKWAVSYGENVNYGPFTSGRDVVVDLIVDDGVSDRGHRRNVFDPSARVAGVACGRHPRYGSVCVIDQAGAFTVR